MTPAAPPTPASFRGSPVSRLAHPAAPAIPSSFTLRNTKSSRGRLSPRSSHVLTACLLAATLLGSCAEDRKVVQYHPFLANLPDAKTGLGPVGDRFGGVNDPNRLTPEDAEKMVVTNPDGSKTLLSKSIRQLMSQVVNCLYEDELELLHDQLMSESTKEEYRARGKDSFAFVEYLSRNREDIVELFRRMPMAENTPAVAMHQPARNTFKLQMTGIAKKGLNFTTFWVTHEQGTWKIMWME